MSMLLESIDGETLEYEASQGLAADKKKWMDQIDKTANKLHEHGLVWGDVKPDNVMIDASGNAILVDSGGGYTREYVDRELGDTEEGGLQRIKRMRAKLLGNL